jgi:hypothetical protein
MNTMVSPLRRLGATFAIAGIAALGSVALAPAASAAQSVTVENGPNVVMEGTGVKGPDSFIIMEQGRKPVFFCDEDKPNQRHNNCEPFVAPGDDRF